MLYKLQFFYITPDLITSGECVSPIDSETLNFPLDTYEYD